MRAGLGRKKYGAKNCELFCFSTGSHLPFTFALSTNAGASVSERLNPYNWDKRYRVCIRWCGRRVVQLTFGGDDSGAFPVFDGGKRSAI